MSAKPGYVVQWTPPWVFATIVGGILVVALAICLVIYASYCYSQSEWPWEAWLEHRRRMRDAEARDRAAEFAHDEKMERIRMGLINE